MKTNSTEKAMVHSGFVVMGIRHFMNGEHHWIAPEDMEEALGCCDKGQVSEMEGYRKPVFTSMADAERYAMSLAHSEYTLAEWEERRPTWCVVEAENFYGIVGKEDYSLPQEAEEWSDAKNADYERECDCIDIANLAVWDSESDEERVSEKTLCMVHKINELDGLTAWWDSQDGALVAVSPINELEGGSVTDFVESVQGFPAEELEYEYSDETYPAAYYKVKD